MIKYYPCFLDDQAVRRRWLDPRLFGVRLVGVSLLELLGLSCLLYPLGTPSGQPLAVMAFPVRRLESDSETLAEQTVSPQASRLPRSRSADRDDGSGCASQAAFHSDGAASCGLANHHGLSA